MSSSPKVRLSPSHRRQALVLSATLLSQAVWAAHFDFNEDWSLDSTTSLSYGTGWRMEQPANVLDTMPFTGLNKVQGLNSFDNNSTPFTQLYMVNEDLSLKYKNSFGAEFSGLAFYDATLMNGKPSGPGTFYQSAAGCNAQVTPAAQLSACGFPQATREFYGRRIRGYDAYLWGNFSPMDMPLNVRVGYQVVNWGEALFIPGGISNANPLSLAALEMPGTQLKDVMLPLPMLYFNWGLSDTYSLEGYGEFGWHFSEAPGMGTNYSVNDSFGGYGAERVLVDMTAAPRLTPGQIQAGELTPAQLAQAYNAAVYGNPSTVLTNKWTGDVPTNLHDQYGLALRITPYDGFEYALYAENYSSHLPVAQFTTGQAFGTAQNAQVALASQNALMQELGISQQLAQQVTTQVSAAEKAYMAHPAGANPVLGMAGAAISACGSSCNGVNAATTIAGINAMNVIDTTTYNMVYPNNIHLFGASFSTNVDGVSLAGEMSYRPNLPVLRDLGDNLVAENAAWAQVLANGGTGSLAGSMQGTTVGAQQTIQDWAQVEEYTADMSAVFNMNSLWHSDGAMAIIEVGAVHYANYDSSQHFASTKALLNTMVPNTINALTLTPTSYLNASEGPLGNYMTPTSWGYRLAMSMTYDDVFPSVNMSPQLHFGQDVQGNSDYTGAFMQGRKSAMIGLNTIYNQAWEVDVAYNAFWGAAPANLMDQLNTLTLILKYTF